MHRSRCRTRLEQPRSPLFNFLHKGAQTAAGVIAGEVAFSALSSLFGHPGGYGGYGEYGGGGGFGFLGGGGGETIVPEDRRFAGATVPTFKLVHEPI